MQNKHKSKFYSNCKIKKIKFSAQPINSIQLINIIYGTTTMSDRKDQMGIQKKN